MGLPYGDIPTGKKTRRKGKKKERDEESKYRNLHPSKAESYQAHASFQVSDLRITGTGWRGVHPGSDASKVVSMWESGEIMSIVKHFQRIPFRNPSL